jgi:regulator of nucleoside diphosphate kinase
MTALLADAATASAGRKQARIAKPPILLAEDEADALFELALAWQSRHPNSAALLLGELARAETVPSGELPPDVVTMRSQVTFLDRASGERHAVELVYPGEADMARGRVSLMTPIGAALIGMRRGSAIDWPNRQGEVRRLEIVEVAQPGHEGRRP